MPARDTPGDLLVQLAAIKAEEKALASRKSVVEESLIAAMRANGQQTVSRSLGKDQTVKGTLVEPERVTYDPEGLRKDLGARIWNKVTKRVLDGEKLEAVVQLGEVDINVVASHATVEDTKPYVKVTGRYAPDQLKTALARPRRVRARKR